ncbi:hypothetical protein AGMMS50256_33690 [Betaproteobacteria bacterium]|nr:hypothetical protein AGMMS50256_33690 [Betaproteobacteria bacterium]
MNKHLFISGMVKCGTTALAAWFIKQGLAEYLVPNTKEPNIYSYIDFGKSCFFVAGGGGAGHQIPGYWTLLLITRLIRLPFHVCRNTIAE